MNQQEFSYRALDLRIEAFTEGPAASLNRPKWTRYSDLVGMMGVLLGLLPSTLILLWEPKMWMAQVAGGGVVLAVVGFAPGFLHSIWQLRRTFLRWRIEQAEQLDHDVQELRRLCDWVASHSRNVVATHLRFVQMARTRLTSKLGVLAGSFDKLGVLPLLIALAVQIKIATDITSIPQWQLVVGLFAGATYLVAMLGALMLLRLQLYEMVLTEALVGLGGHRDGPSQVRAGTGDHPGQGHNIGGESSVRPDAVGSRKLG